MTDKICWIDEDERIWSPERKLLLGLGFEVGTHNNASEALLELSPQSPGDYCLLILDVMLRQGDDFEIFSDHRTQRGLDTGLVLAQELIDRDATWAPKILLFSRANRPEHVERIRSTSKRLKVRYLRKERANQGKKFVQRLKENALIPE